MRASENQDPILILRLRKFKCSQLSLMQVHLGTTQCHDRSNILNLSGIAFLIHEVDERTCLELQMPITMAQP